MGYTESKNLNSLPGTLFPSSVKGTVGALEGGAGLSKEHTFLAKRKMKTPSSHYEAIYTHLGCIKGEGIREKEEAKVHSAFLPSPTAPHMTKMVLLTDASSRLASQGLSTDIQSQHARALRSDNQTHITGFSQ